MWSGFKNFIVRYEFFTNNYNCYKKTLNVNCYYYDEGGRTEIFEKNLRLVCFKVKWKLDLF